MSARNCGADEPVQQSELRRGSWTVEEDTMLIHHITAHGEGNWNSLARSSGLKRTGKSCRLRWLNYLKPDIKRGNLTPQEKSTIFQLHSKWGNSRWSKIAQQLPGRTDNEIKNYWRTRMQNQARQLKRVQSDRFLESVRGFWVPTTTLDVKGDADYSSLVSNSSSQQQLKNRHHHPLSCSSPSSFVFPREADDSMGFLELKTVVDSPSANTTAGAYKYPEFYHSLEDLSFATTMSAAAAADDDCGLLQAARDDWMADDETTDTAWNTDELWQFS
uniref:Uncharacterized protein n=1 Tax=Kalanchoe fedtschenkoi TaxID=63787 RepID=A0A7N0TLJ3_KALFE